MSGLCVVAPLTINVLPFNLQVCRDHCCPLGGGDVLLYGEVPMLQMVMIQYFKHSQIHQLSEELNRMWCDERLVVQTTEMCHVRDNVVIELKSVTHQVPLFWGWTTWKQLCLLPTLSFLGYLISPVCCSINVPCYILNVTNLPPSSLKHFASCINTRTLPSLVVFLSESIPSYLKVFRRERWLHSIGLDQTFMPTCGSKGN